jgi:hypothetical protein
MTIKYPFTHDGIKLFMQSAYDDIFAALASNDISTDHDIFITIGNREIKVPSTAWAYQCMEEYLHEVATDYHGEE